MKKIFLITVVIIIMASIVITGAGCTANATAEPIVPEFMGSDFELSLPDKWEGSTKKELDSVVESLKEADRAQLADEVENSKKELLFFGYNTEDAALDGSVSNLTICGEPSGSISLEEYMKLSYENISRLYEEAGYEFKIIEEDIVPIGNYDETGRVIFEQTIEDVKTKVVQYIIKHESDFWVLTFTTDPEKFDENIGDFDKTFESFKILD